MSQDPLYSRSYRLTLGTLARPNLAIYGNTPAGSVGLLPTPLRIEFEIEKTCVAAANKGQVKITNMNDTNRAALRPGIIGTLEAGYAGALQTLFVGGIAKAKTERQGPDIVTTLDMGDAEASIQNTVLDKSYGAGTLLTQVLTDCCLAMQLPTPAQPDSTQFGLALGIPAVRFAKGLTVHGPVRSTLTRLCRTYGLEWSIQNNAIQIIPLKAHNGVTAETLSKDTGLIGVPSFDGSLCLVQALLNPRLVPGCLIAVQSKTVNGFFKVRKGKWTGDTHGQPWLCELESIPMPALQNYLPSSSLPLQPALGA